jgi:hypothetical protein
MKPTQHDQEAEFLPSASGFDAEFRCLGRRALTERLPKEEDTVIQVRGSKIHKALEESSLEELADSDARTASRCMYAEAKIVQEFDFEGAEVLFEARYWDYDDDFKHTWSCRIDTLHIKPKRIFIGDNKTGWGIPPAIDINWQVRSSAALLADSYYDVEEAVVGLIHPHHPESLYEVRTFTRDDLRDILNTVRGFVKAIQEPEQPRIAGTIQCQFCMAKSICPEYKAHMAAIEQAIADEILDEGYTALIRQSPEERGQMVEHLKEMTKNIKALMAQYVTMATKDETAVKGSKLKSKMIRSLTNDGDAM